MPLPLLAAAGAGIGLIGGIGKMFARGQANRDLKNLMKENVVNPLAEQRLALAKTLLNARMPGSMAVERNIYANQANTISNLQRGATSSADFLSGAGMAQGMTNNAFEKLGVNEAEDYQRRYGNLIGAEEAKIGEDNRVFGNKVQLQGAINENRQNTWQEASNLGFSLADFGLAAANGQGGMSGGFGGQNNGVGYIPKRTNGIGF